jgi:hypothetical protein
MATGCSAPKLSPNPFSHFHRLQQYSDSDRNATTRDASLSMQRMKLLRANHNDSFGCDDGR